MELGELQGETIGEKYKSFNKLVDIASNNSSYTIKDISFEDSDIVNLIRIEVASRRRNVDIILQAFKCRDLIYAYHAIKLCRWLITDKQYEHIINPDYIHSNLLPHMRLKVFNRLMFKIRLSLRDPVRVDAFFAYYKDKDISRALKWLPYCSPSLAEEMVHKYSDQITFSTLEKFKGTNCVYIYCKRNDGDFNNLQRSLHILKNNNMEKYLLFLFELLDAWYTIDHLSAKSTKRIIKRCPHMTLDDLKSYYKVLHLPTLVKYFNGDQIKEFLINNSRSKRYEALYKYDRLKFFVQRLPEADRLDLIKNVFIGKQPALYTNETDLRNSTLIRCLTNMNNAYLWCEYLQFEEAFEELKRFIDVESNPAKRSYMLCTLLSSAKKNYDHIEIVLQYYVDSHLLEGLKFKTQFLQHLVNNVDTLKLNANSWNLLNTLFYSVGVYTKLENTFPEYKKNPFIVIGKRRRHYGERKLRCDAIFVNCIILYNFIHGFEIPKILVKKFKHTTFKEEQHKISIENKQKLFDFLLNLINVKFEEQNIEDETKFEDILEYIQDILLLFKDWNKKLEEYPNIVDKIRKFVKLYSNDSEKYDLSELQTLAKSKKFNLEEKKSDMISPDVLDALKMNPMDLEVLIKEGTALKLKRRSLRRILCKIRIFWNKSIALLLKDFINNNELKSVLSSILSEKEAMKYYASEKVTSENSKVPIVIFKQLQMLRPQVSLVKLLELCGHDNVKTFLQSIHSLMYDMNPFETERIFFKVENLFSSRKKPLLQKHCLGIGLKRLNFNEKLQILKQIWKKTEKNSSRILVFSEVFDLLCTTTDKEIILQYWDALSGFIDEINENELLAIVNVISNVYKIPATIRTEYCRKVEECLKTLPDQRHVQELKKNNAYELDAEAKVRDLKQKMKNRNFYAPYWLQELIIEAPTEEIQMDRYRKLLVPIMEDEQLIFSDKPFVLILRKLYQNLEYLNRQTVVPLAIFTDIQKRMEEKLPFYQNYVFITAGRLHLAYLRIFDENIKKSYDANDVTHKTQVEFGEFCADYLDGEIEKHFPTVYMSFGDALTFLFQSTDSEMQLKFVDAMLKRNARTECFLAVIHDFPRKTYRKPDDDLFCVILEKMRTHPSEEIRMIYCNYFLKTDSL